MTMTGAGLIGQQLGSYLIGPMLGRGGMSVVHRATDRRLGRPVALKVISQELADHAEFRDRFVQEAHAASAIDHPNIVPTYEVGQAGRVLFLAMRLVDGTDLSQLIRCGPPAPRRVMTMLGQIASALDALHAHGVVHLDVKPGNVLVACDEPTGAERAYLADFGLARSGSGTRLAPAGGFLGSAGYASPEHLRGRPVGRASDEYSLGCLLFSALTGHPPYTGAVTDVITAHFRGELPSLAARAGVPAAMDRVLARAMAADPGARYPSCGELIGAAQHAMVRE